MYLQRLSPASMFWIVEPHAVVNWCIETAQAGVHVAAEFIILNTNSSFWMHNSSFLM